MKKKLFCFPFAGGNKYSYKTFERLKPEYLGIISLEYPGRGTRNSEELLTDIQLLANDCHREIEKQIKQNDYAFFGHSMGGLVAFLVARKIMQENSIKPPEHIFISGTVGPSSVVRGAKGIYNLGWDEFKNELRMLNGCPTEILENDEILTFFEPVLRADFKANETYVYQESVPLSIPMTVIVGSEEEYEVADVHLWEKESRLPVKFFKMPGDHFFIFKWQAKLVDLISKTIIS